MNLREEDAVGHDLEARGCGGVFRKPHLVSDASLAKLLAQFLRDATRDASGGDPSGLRVTDHAPAATVAEFEEHFRKLRGFARACLASDDHDLVVANRSLDFLTPLRDGKVSGVGDRKARLRPAGARASVLVAGGHIASIVVAGSPHSSVGVDTSIPHMRQVRPHPSLVQHDTPTIEAHPYRTERFL